MIELWKNLCRINQLEKDKRNNTCRSETIRNRNQVSLVENYEIPKTYSEAKLKKDWPKWKKVMRNELTSFEGCLVWKVS